MHHGRVKGQVFLKVFRKIGHVVLSTSRFHPWEIVCHELVRPEGGGGEAGGSHVKVAWRALYGADGVTATTSQLPAQYPARGETPGIPARRVEALL